MDIVDVLSLKWLDAQKTMLGGEVRDETLGLIPICIHANYDTEAGRELWDKAIAGGYGHIAEYRAPPAPSPEERRAAMPDLERWRVNTVIDLEPGLRDKINSAIDAMPEPQRTISKNKLADVQMFRRTDPLFDLIGGEPSIGKTPEDIDAMWEAAGSLS